MRHVLDLEAKKIKNKKIRNQTLPRNQLRSHHFFLCYLYVQVVYPTIAISNYTQRRNINQKSETKVVPLVEPPDQRQ